MKETTRRYYKDGVLFYMRDFISHAIGKYIEYLDDPESDTQISDDQKKVIQSVLTDFQAWLFRTTADYASR